jgi:arginyl-tRNA synthetase
MTTRDKIAEKLSSILAELGAVVPAEEIEISTTKNSSFGDFASNVAMKSTRLLHKSPLAIAEEIIEKFELDEIEKVEKAGPGFINFYLKNETAQEIIKKIIDADGNFGQLNEGKGEKTMLEYVSANPTGALHLGHARGAAVGDCDARLLKKCGYDVLREYYINDAGSQIYKLARSIKGRYLQELGLAGEVPEDGYHGKDIVAFAQTIVKNSGDKYKDDTEENLEFFRKKGIELALGEIKKDLHEFRVDFDNFSSEKDIRDAGKIEKVLVELKPYCYEKDGATFLNTTKDGDDKDRVIIKSDGSYTYLLPDIAYHKDKFERGYTWLIDLFGADHHGYIARIKSSVKSLGYNPEKLDVDLVQMVRLFKDGNEYKMSKRTGNAVSLKELIEEVGVDAVRFFFVSRAASQHLDFNLDLAKTMGTVNPVYYCQYAHARLNAIIEMGSGQFGIDETGSNLTDPAELQLMKKMASFRSVILDAALTLSPYKITIYVRELASSINEFYTKCRVLDPENRELTESRLGLCIAAKSVLKEGLGLIGVDAPDHM